MLDHVHEGIWSGHLDSLNDVGLANPLENVVARWQMLGSLLTHHVLHCTDSFRMTLTSNRPGTVVVVSFLNFHGTSILQVHVNASMDRM